jgi:methionyl-tRNA formyltransferase
MRIVFMGTPAAAVPSLQRCLDDGHEIVAVWTQPDRPAGRGNKIAGPPVKELALAHNLVVHQPTKIRTDESRELFAGHGADIAVVVAYGRILPKAFLRAPRRGCVNVHFSLLPKYRGAAPVNWAIVNGETKTGVTTMFIEEQLDAGPILLQRETDIDARETAPELMSRLALLGADLLSETLARFDNLKPLSQHDSDATLAPMLEKEDGLINWLAGAPAIERAVRGFQPWPNAYTHQDTQRLIVWRAAVELGGFNPNVGVPGEVISAHGDDLLVKCGEGTVLRLLEVQQQGKRRLSARDFLNGTRLPMGEKLS